ncbi:MAG: LysM domain-containing protein [Arhodomonas sp.]|nr:LysM domain-containing protein [Arhodomonas sp.]
MLKKTLLWGWLVALVVSAAAAAQDSSLRDGHPTRYTVQPGDTLWDIASRFLTKPWYWPEIWHENPEIDNPHLIYPGDVIRLAIVDGEPRLTAERGGGTVKLSPKVRVEELDDAIPTIPSKRSGRSSAATGSSSRKPSTTPPMWSRAGTSGS